MTIYFCVRVSFADQCEILLKEFDSSIIPMIGDEITFPCSMLEFIVKNRRFLFVDGPEDPKRGIYSSVTIDLKDVKVGSREFFDKAMRQLKSDGFSSVMD